MSSTVTPSDRRAFGRRPTYHHAIVHRTGRTPLRCVVRDISAGGALLDFGEPVHLPHRVLLAWEGFEIEAECEVRHTDGQRAGVQFLGDVGAKIMSDILAHQLKTAPQVTAPAPAAAAQKSSSGAAAGEAGVCLVQKAREKIAAGSLLGSIVKQS